MELPVSLLIILMTVSTVFGDRSIPSNRNCIEKGVFCLDISNTSHSLTETIPKSDIILSMTIKGEKIGNFSHTWFFWMAPVLRSRWIIIRLRAKSAKRGITITLGHHVHAPAYTLNQFIWYKDDEAKPIDEMKSGAITDSSSISFQTTELFARRSKFSNTRHYVEVASFGGGTFTHVNITDPFFLFPAKNETETQPNQPSRRTALVIALIVVSAIAVLLLIILGVAAIISKKTRTTTRASRSSNVSSFKSESTVSRT